MYAAGGGGYVYAHAAFLRTVVYGRIVTRDRTMVVRAAPRKYYVHILYCT